MFWLNRNKNKKHTLVASNRLTIDEHQELERVLLNCQIESVSDALIPYLSRMKNALRDYKNGKILFKERFINICEYLEGLKQNPKYALNEFKQKAHINALTLLGSIKIMVFDLSDEVNGYNPKSEMSNSYLIKRLPPNLRLHLSPDSWRLYDVYALLFQSEKEPVLNKDLLEDFPNLEKKAQSSKPDGVDVQTEPFTEAQINTPPNPTVNDTSVSAKPTAEPTQPSAPKEDNALSVDDIFNQVFSEDDGGSQS